MIICECEKLNSKLIDYLHMCGKRKDYIEVKLGLKVPRSSRLLKNK
jgi:hypothetical protein